MSESTASQASEVTVGMVTIDCPDAAVLGAFYRELLGYETLYEADGYAMIGRAGCTPLGFGSDPTFQAPAWPDSGHKQFHLDLAAVNPAAAEARALELGATRPTEQPGGDRWTVLLDPAGHPFCITDAANWG
ncbi:MAG TPA: VOC family protein [Arachnia sp.]|nr:VOC family protein [Arachnia sp.]HMT86276.1 VOC family protein [Arachnia sp.]